MEEEFRLEIDEYKIIVTVNIEKRLWQGTISNDGVWPFYSHYEEIMTIPLDEKFVQPLLTDRQQEVFEKARQQVRDTIDAGKVPSPPQTKKEGSSTDWKCSCSPHELMINWGCVCRRK